MSEKAAAAELKPLPESKPVLRNIKPKKQAPKPLIAPKSMSIPADPFQNTGKYSQTAFQTKVSEADLSESPTKIIRNREPFHTPTNANVSPIRRPKFKQVIPGAPPPPQKPSNAVTDLINHVAQFPDYDIKSNAKPLDVEGLIPKLLPHQCVGVRFMTSRENARAHCRGGILADDMGLGKTIQSIGLILNNLDSKTKKPGTTLVISPLAVINQWKEEIETKTTNLKAGTYHGAKRTNDAEYLHSNYDVVITNYESVTTDYKRYELKTASPLFDKKWFRIIADEAHVFRNPDTKVHKAVMALRTSKNARRWALTGTPVHNRVSDIHSLLNFIQVENQSDVKQVLRAVMLRRSQKILAKVLPELSKEQMMVSLSDLDRDKYQYFLSKPDISMLTRLTRLRQCCDGLGIFMDQRPKFKKEEESDPKEELASSNHKVDIVDTDDDDLLSGMLEKLSLANAKGKPKEYQTHTTKIEKLRTILNEDRKRQTVVFSSFVTMLRSIEPMLQEEGFKYLSYDGGLTNDSRVGVLSEFRNPKSNVNVLLCSLQTAAVGLNLTSASQVVLMEPWWNPQIVDQAIKRVHRLGQTRPVRCVEMFAINSVDERLLIVQNRKREMANDLMGDDEQKMTSGEMRYVITGEEDDL